MTEKMGPKGRVSIVVLGFITMLLGFASFGFDYTGYTISLIGFGIFVTMMLTVGIKRFTDFSSLRGIGTVQKVTIVMALLALAYAIVALPVLGINVPIITQIGSVVYIIDGIVLSTEAL